MTEIFGNYSSEVSKNNNFSNILDIIFNVTDNSSFDSDHKLNKSLFDLSNNNWNDNVNFIKQIFFIVI